MVTSFIANEPGHNQFADVSYFAQTRDGQRRKRIVIDTPSQSVRPFNQLLYRNLSGCPWPRSETCRAKGNTMQVPSILQGESLTRLLQGAVAGAVATMFVGFSWGGWVTGGTAKELQQKGVSAALVLALSP